MKSQSAPVATVPDSGSRLYRSTGKPNTVQLQPKLGQCHASKLIVLPSTVARQGSMELYSAYYCMNWTTRRPPDDRKETQTAVVWSCVPFIRSGQNHLARHSERGKKTRQTEEEVGRQDQGMDRPGVRQVPEGSGEQRKMEKTGCKIICGAPTTLAVTGLMMMMMMMMYSAWTVSVPAYGRLGRLEPTGRESAKPERHITPTQVTKKGRGDGRLELETVS